MGKSAFDKNTTGSVNLAIVSNDLSSNKLESNNTTVGQKTENNKTGANITVMGALTGIDITTGLRNNLMGSRSGDALTNTGYNIAIWFGDLDLDAKGSKSVTIGDIALFSRNSTSSTDAFNVAIGMRQAMQSQKVHIKH